RVPSMRNIGVLSVADPKWWPRKIVVETRVSRFQQRSNSNATKKVHERFAHRCPALSESEGARVGLPGGRPEARISPQPPLSAWAHSIDEVPIMLSQATPAPRVSFVNSARNKICPPGCSHVFFLTHDICDRIPCANILVLGRVGLGRVSA